MLSPKMISDENPQNIRIKFRKVGMLRYISHLDLQRTFAKVIVRSGIPAWYTKGFNPHAKLVFALPLSIGTQSECELLDIRLSRYMSCDEVKERLNSVLTDELSVIDVYEPESKFQDIGYAKYEINIVTNGASDDMADNIRALFSKKPILMFKHTKSGEKEIDIAPLIDTLNVSYDGECDLIRLSATLSATSENYLSPEMLITAMKDSLEILSTDIMSENYTIMRTALYLADGKTEFK
ncbi:MAG: TIGR03936 family radical SAM-associated protein [Clostridia bacterium]|nr:TIGR03936 family radical SAM-associated protein [Clostridia bacterium]